MKRTRRLIKLQRYSTLTPVARFWKRADEFIEIRTRNDGAWYTMGARHTGNMRHIDLLTTAGEYVARHFPTCARAASAMYRLTPPSDTQTTEDNSYPLFYILTPDDRDLVMYAAEALLAKRDAAA